MKDKTEVMLREYFESGEPVSEELKMAVAKKLYEAEIKKKKRILLAMAAVPLLVTLMLTVFVFFFGGITIGAVIVAGYLIFSASLSILFVLIASKYAFV